ncbi:hypothetical protein NC652_011908 [Populus alba x Populus x berolinensis]|uniref:Uncharacterized protein n=1 Tax=Populus alba x Populus x berolinensis TaxID=444605 RepID=A0AAD6W751_9ROSI|nr:hypothetical protein NC652_011908 [Populus alba x Populus x berolinensis]KAJ7001747.1 hypothetical protein NC653_011985 [Populus alba x Populus x berolinensis]
MTGKKRKTTSWSWGSEDWKVSENQRQRLLSPAPEPGRDGGGMRLERRYQGRGGGRRQGLDLERKGEEAALWLEWKVRD